MSKKHLTIEAEQFNAFKTLEIEGPLLMYNLLKYKDQVEDLELTGAQVYRRYLKAVLPFFEKANAQVVFKGEPIFTLIGPEEEKYWDEILIVKYTNKADFLGMITAEGYPSAIREKALIDSRLILCSTYQK